MPRPGKYLDDVIGRHSNPMIASCIPLLVYPQQLSYMVDSQVSRLALEQSRRFLVSIQRFEKASTNFARRIVWIQFRPPLHPPPKNTSTLDPAMNAARRKVTSSLLLAAAAFVMAEVEFAQVSSWPRLTGKTSYARSWMGSRTSSYAVGRDIPRTTRSLSDNPFGTTVQFQTTGFLPGLRNSMASGPEKSSSARLI